jgi:hypothetical protein
MTGQQIKDFGDVLGPAGAGLFMWRYDAATFDEPEYQNAFQHLQDRQAQLSSMSWYR